MAQAATAYSQELGSTQHAKVAFASLIGTDQNAPCRRPSALFVRSFPMCGRITLSTRLASKPD